MGNRSSLSCRRNRNPVQTLPFRKSIRNKNKNDYRETVKALRGSTQKWSEESALVIGPDFQIALFGCKMLKIRVIGGLGMENFLYIAWELVLFS